MHPSKVYGIALLFLIFFFSYFFNKYNKIIYSFLSKGGERKIAVGDTHGVIQVFNAKKGVFSSAFKTLPSRKEVSRLAVGGPREERNRVFAASGSVISGYTKKGKHFMTLDTNRTEAVTSLYSEESSIWCAGQYVYNSYLDGRENGYFLSPDRVRDVTVELAQAGALMPNAILACQDQCIRVLARDSSELSGVTMGSAPQVLERYERPHLNGLGNTGRAAVLYGAEDGTAGQVLLEQGRARLGWALENDRGLGAVQAVAVADLRGTGAGDIIVGREDGLVQIFSHDAGSDAAPRLVWSRNLGESITAVQGGLVTGTKSEDVVVATYGGKLLAFVQGGVPGGGGGGGGVTSSSSSVALASILAGGSGSGLTGEDEFEAAFAVASANAAATGGSGALARGGSAGAGASASDSKSLQKKTLKQIKELREEIDKLHAKTAKAKAQYDSTTSLLGSVSVGPTSQIRINDKFSLSPDDASHVLRIEIEAPIDTVVLQSDVPMDLVDVANNQAIVSRSPPDPQNDCALLATYRCPDTGPTNRIEIKLATTEGVSGTLRAYVIPRLTPKTSQMASYAIKPLSLHQRLREVDTAGLPLSTLTFSGSFSVTDAHVWLVMCLPDVPDRILSETVTYHFQSAFLGTVLIVECRKGLASFRSDNVSALAVLKDCVTRDATAKKIRVDVASDINPASVARAIDLLHPMLERLLKLALQVKLTEALRELQVQEEDTSYLSADLVEILENEKDIQEEFREQPRRLDFIRAVAVKLYVDRWRLEGRSVNPEKIQRILSPEGTYTKEGLKEAFESGK
jgi:Bardet-Biedl syndrome 7 protein